MNLFILRFRSAPVRWGNGAADQRQHDVYGEILDCAALAQLADMAGEAWRQPDQGIWEVRSEGRVFTYSAAMCQVALDRAAAIGERLDLPGPVPAWRAAADKLRQTILDRSWDEDAQTPSEHLSVADVIAGDGPVAAYLALPPAVFPVAVSALHDAGLPPGSRIVLEKPFGEDLDCLRTS